MEKVYRKYMYTKKQSQAAFKYWLAQKSQCMQILTKDYQKTFKKLTRFFLLHPVHFMDMIMKNKPVSLCIAKDFQKKNFLVIYYLGNFNDLIRSSLLFIPKHFIC